MIDDEPAVLRPVLTHAAVVLGLAALTLAVFWNSVGSGMVLDNEFIVRGDPRIRALGWDNVRLIFTQDYWYPKGVGRLYRPLTTLSFAVNHAVLGSGDAPAGYHWVNIALHVLNAALVYFATSRVVGSRGVAASIAALFAVHPLAVESVTNIVGRADLLAAASVLGGFLIYVRSRRSVSWQAAWLVLLAVTAEVGVLCKENALVIAGVLPLYELFAGADPTLPHRRASRLLAGWAALVPAILTMVWVRAELFPRWPLPPMAFLDDPIRGATFVAGRLTAIAVVTRYVGLVVLPLRLSCDYGFDQIRIFAAGRHGLDDWRAVVALILVTAGVAWAFARRRSAAGFFALFFFVTLAPTSNVFVVIDSIMAERFAYLPMVGVLGCVVLGGARIVRSGRVRVAILAAVLVALGVRTIARNADWESNVSLWRSAVGVVPRSFRAHRSLAWALFQADPHLDRDAETIATEAESAVALLQPLPLVDRDKLSYLQLGMIRLAAARGPSDAALRSAVRVLRTARLVDRRQNARHGRMELARGRNEFEIRDVGQPAIYEQLGLALATLGRHEAALGSYRSMRHLDPTSARAYRGILDEELALTRYDEAAVTLAQIGLLREGGDDLGEKAVAVYRALGGGDVPAVVREDARYQLNLENPLVRAHVCAAAHGLVRIAVAARRWDAAADARRLVSANHCVA